MLAGAVCRYWQFCPLFFNLLWGEGFVTCGSLYSNDLRLKTLRDNSFVRESVLVSHSQLLLYSELKLLRFSLLFSGGIKCYQTFTSGFMWLLQTAEELAGAKKKLSLILPNFKLKTIGRVL